MGKDHPWAQAYSPSRKLPGTSKDVLEGIGQEVVHTTEAYKDFKPLVGTDSVDIEDLQSHSGCVVQKGLNKMAVYKDSQGKVHKYSAVCPHMKCNVKWNPIDYTFDCPCHGSIFDTDGRCMNGHAKANLSPVE